MKQEQKLSSRVPNHLRRIACLIGMRICLPLARTIDLSQQQIGAPYRETQAYVFSQLSQEDQQSINDYSGKLLTFFHDEVARLTEDGSADYVQIRDSEALQQAVLARFELDPNANALLERMQELGQITL